MSDIYSKLAKVQQSLNAPKGRTNEFGGYAYRSCEDILQAAKPLLNDAVIIINDAIEMIGERYYVKATASFHCGSDSVSATAYAREPLTKKGMDDAQLTGSTSSYARKYALNALLLIDDNKDPDAANKHDSSALEDAKNALADSITAIKEGIAENNYSAAAESWFELTNEEKTSIWVAPRNGGPFTTEERKIMQTKEFREAYYGVGE